MAQLWRTIRKKLTWRSTCSFFAWYAVWVGCYYGTRWLANPATPGQVIVAGMGAALLLVVLSLVWETCRLQMTPIRWRYECDDCKFEMSSNDKGMFLAGVQVHVEHEHKRQRETSEPNDQV